MRAYRRFSKNNAAAHIRDHSVRAERPKLHKTPVDIIIEQRYRTNRGKFEEFGHVVMKSSQKFLEAIRETNQHIEEAQRVGNENNTAGQNLAYTNALRSCTKALARASAKKEIAKAFYTRATILEVFDQDLAALTDMNMALHCLSESEEPDEELKARIEALKARLIGVVSRKKPEFEEVSPHTYIHIIECSLITLGGKKTFS